MILFWIFLSPQPISKILEVTGLRTEGVKFTYLSLLHLPLVDEDVMDLDPLRPQREIFRRRRRKFLTAEDVFTPQRQWYTARVQDL